MNHSHQSSLLQADTVADGGYLCINWSLAFIEEIQRRPIVAKEPEPELQDCPIERIRPIGSEEWKQVKH